MNLKNNLILKCIIIPICVILCFIGNFLPAFGPLSKEAVQVLFIFLGSLILWLTIGIDWPSLLCLFALGFVNVSGLGFKGVFTNSFGNFTFIFLLFTFILTYALSKTSLIKRTTIAFINTGIAKRNGLMFSFLFLLSVLLIGLVVSPSVLFVVILPILNEILKIAGIEKGDKLGKALLMGLGFTVSISSGMTPIAHVFPVLAMQNGKIDISPLNYCAFAMPVGLIVFLLMFVMLFIIYRPNTKLLEGIDTSSISVEIGAINRKDIITLVTFIVVLILWITPDIFKDILPDIFSTISGWTIAMPPLLGTIVLCIISVDNKPILKVDEAFKNVPWSSLVMCAATLALGAFLTNDAIGIKTVLQNSLGTGLANLSPLLIIIIFALWAAIQTNLSSNMVTATLVATVAFGVLPALGDAIHYNSVICIIGLLASFAFATPPSMPHIAIVAGSEHCNTRDVLIFGGILMFVSVIVALGVGYPLGMLVL